MAIIYGKNKKADEFGVLEKLSQLDDDYHVLCDVTITLLEYVKYNGKKDKTAFLSILKNTFQL